MARTKGLFALVVFTTVSGAFGQSSKTVNWVVPANGNQYTETVPVGGSLRFSWTSTHDLWEIPSASCPSSFTNGSGITQLAPRSSGGDRTVNFTTAGTRYFACSVSSHCREGQLITVRVGSAAPAPGPSRYGMSYGGGATCGPNSTSGSGYGGSSGSGSNYTGNSTYGGTTPSTNTSSPVTTSSFGGGSASYGGGGANYGGGSSDNYGSGRKLRSVRLF